MGAYRTAALCTAPSNLPYWRLQTMRPFVTRRPGSRSPTPPERPADRPGNGPEWPPGGPPGAKTALTSTRRPSPPRPSADSIVPYAPAPPHPRGSGHTIPADAAIAHPGLARPPACPAAGMPDQLGTAERMPVISRAEAVSIVRAVADRPLSRDGRQGRSRTGRYEDARRERRRPIGGRRNLRWPRRMITMKAGGVVIADA